VIGQFSDIAEEVVQDGVTHIITAAVSGCIIGEYLGKILERKFRKLLDVDHMVFARDGINPVKGILPESFRLQGDHVLFVDDAVMETRTALVMLDTMQNIAPNSKVSLLTVDIDPDTKESGFLQRFNKVYLFEE